MTDNLDLLATPLEIAEIAKTEEILDALEVLHMAALSDNERKIRNARYASRRILMKYRPVTFREALGD